MGQSDMRAPPAFLTAIRARLRETLGEAEETETPPLEDALSRRALLGRMAAVGLVVPAERFVRRFFPVGIQLAEPGCLSDCKGVGIQQSDIDALLRKAYAEFYPAALVSSTPLFQILKRATPIANSRFGGVLVRGELKP